MDFWRAVEVLGRRKWLILLSVVVAVGLTFGATRLTGSRWTATVRMVTPAMTPQQSVQGTAPTGPPDPAPDAECPPSDDRPAAGARTHARPVLGEHGARAPAGVGKG